MQGKRETMDYFEALLRLAGMPAQLLAGEEWEMLREAAAEHRKLKTALAAEYVPPMKRTDIARLAGTLYAAAFSAALCKNYDDAVLQALMQYARCVEELVAALRRFRKTEAFGGLAQRVDEAHACLSSAILAAKDELPFSAWQPLVACAEALWVAGETVEQILIKYA